MSTTLVQRLNALLLLPQLLETATVFSKILGALSLTCPRVANAALPG